MDKNYKKTTCSPCTKCDSYISVCTPKKDAVCAVVTSPFSTTPFPTEWTTIFHVDTIEPSTKPGRSMFVISADRFSDNTA